MSAADKTRNLLRLDLPLGLLEKNSDNPNKMNARQFDLLIDNLERTGLTDPILVRPLDVGAVTALVVKNGKDKTATLAAIVAQGLKFRIVGGHHRFEGATYLGFDEAPCTIILDPKFDEDQERFQLVRMNMIKGRLDPQAFMNLYSQLSESYSDEILQDSFGFADEAEFKKMVNQMAKVLPDADSQKKFKEAAAELKTIDGLSKLLNQMFTMYGDTLPHGYMVVDYGGERSYWLRADKTTISALDLIGTMCIENNRTMDDLVGGVVKLIAKGELKDVVAKLIEAAPNAKLPAGLQTSPTKDNIAKALAV